MALTPATPLPLPPPSSQQQLEPLPPSQTPQPPSLPAHLFETLTPLTTLLEKVLTGGSSGTVGGALGGSDGQPNAAQTVVDGEPAQTTTLAIKEFSSEVLRVKHAVAAARIQLRGLPDLERSIAEQKAESVALRGRLARAREVRREIGARAEDLVGGGSESGRGVLAAAPARRQGEGGGEMKVD